MYLKNNVKKCVLIDIIYNYIYFIFEVGNQIKLIKDLLSILQVSLCPPEAILLNHWTIL